MRKLAILFCIPLAFSLCMSAAENYEASAGYNHITPGKDGFYLSGAYLPIKHVGAEGDIGAYFRSRNGVSDNASTYLFGPKVMGSTKDGVFTPFAHLLFGGAREFSTNYFGWLLGAGVDVGNKKFGVRFKLDAVRFNDDTHARVGIGGVYRW